MDHDAIMLSIVFILCAVIGLAYLSYDSHVRSKKKEKVINNDRPKNITIQK
jgi:hypothetical protein